LFSKGRSVRRAASHRARLMLQSLEDRRVPATYTVSNNADSGAGSLRQAITDANNNPGTDSIVFSSLFNSPQPIDLLTELPAISDDVSVNGPGASNCIIERSNAAADTFRILTVKNTSRQLAVTLSGITLTKGDLVVPAHQITDPNFNQLNTT